ncbi:MAG: DNA-dependent helicase II [Bacteroidetes bacterium ADurb.Bin397]|nr:MAG: DNA-dependent helicase II [Bacteroidetes bacterium ADurb.Bin397]
MSYAISRYKWGNLISCEPSRFIGEINPDFIDDQTALVIKGADINRQRNWSNFGNSNRNGKPEVVPSTPGPGFKKVTQLKKAPVAAVAGEPFEADDPASINVGMTVVHQKFGEGSVTAMEGDFPDLKATVHFPGHGHKQLLLKYAKLKIVRN